jgi:hypothetical protein
MEAIENMTIGDIIRQYGPRAGQLIDEALCTGEGKVCCPGTTLKLGYAAALKGKEGVLPELVRKISEL